MVYESTFVSLLGDSKCDLLSDLTVTHSLAGLLLRKPAGFVRTRRSGHFSRRPANPALKNIDNTII